MSDGMSDGYQMSLEGERTEQQHEDGECPSLVTIRFVVSFQRSRAGVFWANWDIPGIGSGSAGGGTPKEARDRAIRHALRSMEKTGFDQRRLVPAIQVLPAPGMTETSPIGTGRE